MQLILDSKYTKKFNFFMQIESNTGLIPVYMMPGMAAKASIFEYISLDPNRFEVIYLTWKLPTKNERLEDYAQRMCEDVIHQNPVLIGVSFGGILVQEMAKLIDVRQVIIISSLKSYQELPTRMKFARKTNAFKVLPTSLINYMEQLDYLPLGKSFKKRLQLYKKYMFVSDKYYLDWSIENIVSWEQKQAPKDIVHIHGDADLVFPLEHIENCHVVPGGTHIMIINKYRWFNKHLPNFITYGNQK